MEAVHYDERACRFAARLQQDDYLRLDEIIRCYRDKPGYLIPALKDAQALFSFLPMEVVLSTIRYFKNEYEAHIHEKRCPALMCSALFQVQGEAGSVQAVRALLQGVPGTGYTLGKETARRHRPFRLHAVQELYQGLKYGAIE